MTEDRLRDLLVPYVRALEGERFLPPDGLYGQLLGYLELLLRWNARTNLTAVRDPEEIVRRHFGESVFAAVHLAPRITPGMTLLDLGSGAGFPGLPIQLCHPELVVTLAESQGKKSAFLREVVRVLGLNTEVWAGRAEEMPADRRFGMVCLRAVDKMDSAREVARTRVGPNGLLVQLAVRSSTGNQGEVFPVPESSSRVLAIDKLASG